MSALDSAESPTDGRRARTRRALVDAGLRLLAERPIDAIAIDDIVREAAVAKGSFYNHFEDKDALARTIAAEIRLRVETRVGEANRGVDDPARRVVRAVCVYLRHVLDDPQRAGVLLRVHALAAYASAPLNKGILEDVSAGLLSGRFAVPTAEAGVLYIMGVAQLALARAHDEPNPAVTIALGQQLCSLLLRGLGLPPTEADAIAAQAAHEIIQPSREAAQGR
ncbi:MAG: TetR/AcrR family transcriptional regulator [Caulobacterales bacterium]